MKKVQLKDKKFVETISSETIEQSVQKVADQINEEMAGLRPIFVVVLNGAFMFASDLLKKINIDCELTFVKVASYEGTETTGKVKTLIGLNLDIEDREVIIVEDIVDTGITIEMLINDIKHQNPSDVKIATLLFKPGAYQKDIPIDYVAMEVANDFLVGYGLDYDQLGRNLDSIYVLDETPEPVLN
jgi:hypoxanthine phosphoribosyltransferase